MKIDTHTHVLLTKSSSFEFDDVKLHFDIARAHGLDVVFLTEHLDATHFTSLYSGIFDRNHLRGQFLDDGIIKLTNGLIVVSGTEVPLNGGGEVGLCTKMSVIHSLQKKNGFYSLESLITFLNGTGEKYSLIGNHLCHPKKWIENIEKHIDSIDAIEVLSKYKHLRKEYKDLAESLGKPLVSGSDSHTWVQFGLSYTDVNINIFSISAFKQAMMESKFNVYMSENTDVMINVAELVRAHFKLKLI